MPLDPRLTAEELLRLLGVQAEETALKRAAAFLQANDIDNARDWLEVRAHVRQIMKWGGDTRH
ncbi:hypothetical protein AA23498_2525 [Acetobacter nitrogenifigens DSM 23921 = NBRC 105050]|uniref:Uncharacterized protein n=1 Tax=Acetobacter nitrogenifigens DSM 23921 = NBRC 105050 TaxID=1120919 RepID=A0A511X6A1_9PROT|nr:hypothetical protein [Acetobacter nitrogenifigens]GBQ96058.1 hypothetical protein AA23498_2525 [Acetobacter nitrogenifigens DSM 23921 = NBRC 105050]GEN58459.1 hypothetical protein ANI02nite_03430 [Acetobacter nitrogenifigens DSM 23921 = NBRC 105050]